jgi:hypothetical protein
MEFNFNLLNRERFRMRFQEVKKYITLIFVVIICFGCTALWPLADLDGLVKNAIEDYGSKITQTKVTTGNVKININNGQGIIENFSIQNPRGFNTLYALKINQFEFTLDTSTLKNEVTVIHQIKIEAPDIIYEKSDDNTNYEVIERNIKEYIESLQQNDPIGSNELAGQSKKVSQESQETKKFIIEEIVINNPKVAVSAGFMGGKTIALNFPSLVLKNIGLEKKGVPASEIGKEVVHVLKERLSQSVNFDEIKKIMKSLGEKAMKYIGRDGSKAVGKIKSLVKD